MKPSPATPAPMELPIKSLPQGPQKHFLNSTPPSHPPGQGPWTFSSSPTCPGLCSTPNKTVSSRQARFCDLSQHTSSWCGAGGDPHVCPGPSSCLPCDPSLDLNPPICAMGCQDQQASLPRVPRAAQGAGLQAGALSTCAGSRSQGPAVRLCCQSASLQAHIPEPGNDSLPPR